MSRRLKPRFPRCGAFFCLFERPRCARPCGQPHSGPSHVTLPPPARGQVRRSGLGRLSPGPINFPRPRDFPAGLFFWVCSVAIVPGDYDHRSGHVGAGCRQFYRMPRHGSLAMWEAWTTAMRPPSRRTAAAAQGLIARVGPPISHWGMSRPLAPLLPRQRGFPFLRGGRSPASRVLTRMEWALLCAPDDIRWGGGTLPQNPFFGWPSVTK